MLPRPPRSAAAGRQRTGQGRYGPGQGYRHRASPRGGFAEGTDADHRARWRDSRGPAHLPGAGPAAGAAQRQCRLHPCAAVERRRARHRQQPASDGLEGSAGIYLDNVYLGRPGMAVFDLLDIEQLELLRGPQGTLFGKNTTAGVLNISTRAPTFTTERTVEVSGGQDGYFQGRGTVSGPLGETLAGRLSAYRTRDDGYIKNIHDDNYLNGGERQARAGNCCSSRTRTSACAGSPTTTRRIRATAAWWSTAPPSVSGSAPRWSALRRCAMRSAGRSTSTAASTSACTRAAARWRPTGTSPAATA